jgi:hypothetical protein
MAFCRAGFSAGTSLTVFLLADVLRRRLRSEFQPSQNRRQRKTDCTSPGKFHLGYLSRRSLERMCAMAKFGGPTVPNSGNASCLVFCDTQTTRLPSQAARSEHWIIWPDSTMSRLVRTTVEDRQSRPSTADVQQLSNARTRISIRSR